MWMVKLSLNLPVIMFMTLPATTLEMKMFMRMLVTISVNFSLPRGTVFFPTMLLNLNGKCNNDKYKEKDNKFNNGISEQNFI